MTHHPAVLYPDHPRAERLCRDERYHFDAYVFVFEALRHAQEELGMGTDHIVESDLDTEMDAEKEGLLDSDSEDRPERHVTGQELCEAMRQYAHTQYGYMAKSVLNHWGIQSTSDFGEIVFNLIEIEQMRKTPNDRREDFDDVFDFDEGFRHSFRFPLPDSTEEPRR